MINSVVVKDVDDIDHLTIKRRQGKGFDKALAAKYIRDAVTYYPSVENMEHLVKEPLEEEEEQALYDELIAIRTVLMAEQGLV